MKSPYKFEKEERGKRRREEKEEQESPPGSILPLLFIMFMVLR